MTPMSDKKEKVEYRVTVKKYGNSTCVLIPAYILREYDIKIGDKVNVTLVKE